MLKQPLPSTKKVNSQEKFLRNFKIQWIERLSSTNTFIKERLTLSEPLPSGTVIAAREQTHGRGRYGRKWLAAVNENLTFSILLRIGSNPQKIPSIAMAAAVAVIELLDSEGVNADLKWPNDVLVNGKKICGILSERISDAIIVGIGLNVNMENTKQIDQPATSIRIETGIQRNIDDLLKRLLKHLFVWLKAWEQGGFSAIRKNWEQNIQTLGKIITVRDGNSVRTGTFRGFGPDGELLLEQNGILITLWAGDLKS